MPRVKVPNQLDVRVHEWIEVLVEFIEDVGCVSKAIAPSLVLVLSTEGV